MDLRNVDISLKMTFFATRFITNLIKHDRFADVAISAVFGFTIFKYASYIMNKTEFTFLFKGMEKNQFQDLILLLDALGRMTTAAQYRKYRPAVPRAKGNYKEW